MLQTDVSLAFLLQDHVWGGGADRRDLVNVTVCRQQVGSFAENAKTERLAFTDLGKEISFFRFYYLVLFFILVKKEVKYAIFQTSVYHLKSKKYRFLRTHSIVPY